MKKIFLLLATVTTFFGAYAAGKWDMGGTEFNVDTLFHATTGPGVTTTGLKLSWQSDGNYSTNVFYSTVDLTNPSLEIRGVQAKDNPDAAESVLSMGNRKNQQGNGQYISGINGDFFNMGESPTRTLGHSIVDGKLNNIGIGGAGWMKWASYVMVDGEKDIRIDQGFKVVKDLVSPGGTHYAFHVNGERGVDELVIYTPELSSTNANIWGAECTAKLISGSLADNSGVFEVTGEPSVYGVGGNMAVPADGFVLSGHGGGRSFVEQLKPGDKVSMGMSVTLNGKPVKPRQAIGGSSMLVINGKEAPDQYFSADVIDHFPSSQARTAIGYNKDRSKLIMLVADKYAKYATDSNGNTKVTDPDKLAYGKSTGFFMYRMAQLMLNLDCYTAMACDGGGSSQLYNKELGIRNVPYGNSYLRPVANGIFAVSTTPFDNEIAAIEVVQKNVRLAVGESFTPRVYGFNKYGVLVDNDVKDFTFSVAPSMGAVDGTAFTAGDAAESTRGVVALGNLKAGVSIIANGGGTYVTSGDDDAPLMVKAAYNADEPMGIDK